jgi:hypothetical protein
MEFLEAMVVAPAAQDLPLSPRRQSAKDVAADLWEPPPMTRA